MTYVLHGRVRSRALRTLWLLEELGAAYRYVSTMPHSAEAMALNPRGAIPVLETPDGAVTDSLAQMHFLADRHGGFTHPAGSMARARQDAFTFAVLDLMDAPLWTLALHGFGLPEERRVAAAKDTARWQVETRSGVLAAMMEGPYAVGDGPTVADILLAHCCGWARGQRIDLDPRLLDHMRGMRARDAFTRAMAHEEPSS